MRQNSQLSPFQPIGYPRCARQGLTQCVLMIATLQDTDTQVGIEGLVRTKASRVRE